MGDGWAEPKFAYWRSSVGDTLKGKNASRTDLST